MPSGAGACSDCCWLRLPLLLPGSASGTKTSSYWCWRCSEQLSTGPVQSGSSSRGERVGTLDSDNLAQLNRGKCLRKVTVPILPKADQEALSMRLDSACRGADGQPLRDWVVIPMGCKSKPVSPAPFGSLYDPCDLTPRSYLRALPAADML